MYAKLEQFASTFLRLAQQYGTGAEGETCEECGDYYPYAQAPFAMPFVCKKCKLQKEIFGNEPPVAESSPHEPGELPDNLGDAIESMLDYIITNPDSSDIGAIHLDGPFWAKFEKRQNGKFFRIEHKGVARTESVHPPYPIDSLISDVSMHGQAWAIRVWTQAIESDIDWWEEERSDY